jgi:hypothetical protein
MHFRKGGGVECITSPVERCRNAPHVPGHRHLDGFRVELMPSDFARRSAPVALP